MLLRVLSLRPEARLNDTAATDMNVFRFNKTVPCTDWAISSGQQMAANLQILGAYCEMLGRLREMRSLCQNRYSFQTQNGNNERMATTP
jgi:hypothetical protein